MKKIKLHLTVFAVLALSLVLYSCDTGEYLSSPALGSLDKQVLANQKGADALLVGAYAALNGQNIGGTWSSGGTNWIYGSVAGGDAHKGSNSGDQPPINKIMDMTQNPTNGFFNDFWTARYEGVSRANSVISLLPQVEDMSDAQKTAYEAEARFLRGHYYFELKRMYNNIPWIDEETTNFEQPNTGETAATWAKIEADFQFAYDNLPETQSQAGKANKWAAASYLAKTYVYQGNWSDAQPLLNNIINQGVTASGDAYALQDNYGYNFRADYDNSSESVFAIQYTGPDGTGTIDNSRQEDMLNYPYGSPFNCCGFYQPTQDLVNSYRTDSNGLPMPEDYNAEMVKNDMGVATNEPFNIYEGTVDPRLDYSVGRRGVPFKDWGPHPGVRWIRDQAYAGPFNSIKHIYRQENASQFSNGNEWAPGSAVNYDIIRFADVLLWAAEAEVEVGTLAKAREYVNRVRGRVADDSYGDGWVDYTKNQPFALATVGSESEMTSLDANPGDWVVRTDTETTFVLLKGEASNAGNWQEYEDPNYTVSTYPAGHPAFSSKESAREAVHFERKLELSMEGHRYFDLVRWGEAKEKLDAFYDYMGGELGFSTYQGASFTSSKNEYYPIPQTQIDLTTVEGQPTLEQNQGY
ncbi:RagB/SusD family nutrient uptake outer membrane protein [Fodinibius salsisoli]|uniref:RagB/SusD family nutrient uptake outer membrane protein n=1 Tax=Fodinibius salsisoli TaxID=2820877 RepID=A0ABT3PNU4_9BACT|nr:RagB/SusD family nutrient uptake outer membrane protein [Fodinibius salsisoli]MCW9707525.1 RagB/SusD family nutrient uptake outer membrane protein [Fodinibius salsisoli]